MSDNDDGLFIAVVCILLLAFGSYPLWIPSVEPEGTTTIEEVQDVAVFIAVHPYFGHWIDYNGTISIIVNGRTESGECMDSWFLTSYRYERETDYTVIINGTIVATDYIPPVGNFATWHGETWWGYRGELVAVRHINLTLFEVM